MVQIERPISDLLREFPGEAIRLALLQTHYRQPLDFTRDGINQAKRTLDRFYGALRAAADGAALADEDNGGPGQTDAEVIAALADDLNTPLALGILHERLTALNRAAAVADKAHARTALLAAGQPLGLLAQNPEAWMRGQAGSAIAFDEAAICTRIAARTDARKARNFGEADRLRAELLAEGIILEDTAAGTIWRRA